MVNRFVSGKILQQYNGLVLNICGGNRIAEALVLCLANFRDKLVDNNAVGGCTRIQLRGPAGSQHGLEGRVGIRYVGCTACQLAVCIYSRMNPDSAISGLRNSSTKVCGGEQDGIIP